MLSNLQWFKYHFQQKDKIVICEIKTNNKYIRHKFFYLQVASLKYSFSKPLKALYLAKNA